MKFGVSLTCFLYFKEIGCSKEYNFNYRAEGSYSLVVTISSCFFENFKSSFMFLLDIFEVTSNNKASLIILLTGPVFLLFFILCKLFCSFSDYFIIWFNLTHNSSISLELVFCPTVPVILLTTSTSIELRSLIIFA